MGCAGRAAPREARERGLHTTCAVSIRLQFLCRQKEASSHLAGWAPDPGPAFLEFKRWEPPWMNSSTLAVLCSKQLALLRIAAHPLARRPPD